MGEPTETEPQLTFDWSKPRRQSAGLLLWLILTGIGLAGFFFLFRVVYQTPRHFIPATSQITLLSPTDPAARALLQRVADRDFFVFSNNKKSDDDPSLDDRAPVFHPSFEKHELRLQDLPQRDSKPPPVRLLDVTVPTLPPPDLHDLHAPPAAVTALPLPPPSAPFTPALHLSGALAERKIVSMPDFSSLSALDCTAWRFQLGVDVDGRVTFALPLATAEKAADSSEALRLLSEVRFAPEDQNNHARPPMWGVATFEWTRPGPKP
jgi:hypothetical protein